MAEHSGEMDDLQGDVMDSDEDLDAEDEWLSGGEENGHAAPMLSDDEPSELLEDEDHFEVTGAVPGPGLGSSRGLGVWKEQSFEIVKIPKELLPLFMGKGKGDLMAIGTKTKTQIDPPRKGDNCIMVTGRQEDVALATQLLRQHTQVTFKQHSLDSIGMQQRGSRKRANLSGLKSEKSFG
jgi:hypothetical protein